MTVAGSFSASGNHGRALCRPPDNTTGMPSRRRFLLGLAAAATVAGCTNASTDATATADPGGEGPTTSAAGSTITPGDDLSVADAGYTVNVAGSSDGAVSVADDRIAFTEPIEKAWQSVGYQDGVRLGSDGGGPTPVPEADDEPPLSVGPTLDPTDDTQHAFATPIYDAEAERFELWFYVDETYRNAHDSHYVVWGTGRRRDLQSREADFTQRAEGIYRATVTWDRPVSADMALPFGTLLDRPMAEVTPTDTRPPYTAVGVAPRLSRPSVQAPQISFDFEYDEADETVTITHDGGDTADGSNLTVTVAGEPTAASFSGEVAAGDRVTVDVSGAASGERLEVRWESESVDSAAVLGSIELP